MFHKKDRSQNSQTTRCPSSSSLWADDTGGDLSSRSVVAPPPKKARKTIQKLKTKTKEVEKEKKKRKKPAPGRPRSIRIYPTSDQMLTLRKWMGTVRWTYNQCVRLVYIDKTTSNNQKEFRAAVVSLDSPAVSANPWLKEVPYDVQDDGVLDFIKAEEINKM